MRNNYDIKKKLSERSSKYLLNYILERLAGNREPVKGMLVSSELNTPGTLVNSLKGEIYKGVVESNVVSGEIQFRMSIPLGVSGSIDYVSLIGGSHESGTIVETIKIPTVEKLSMVSIDITIILVSYNS